MGFYERLERTELLISRAALDKLRDSKVIVFGVGGVGGYVCEALVRAGIGSLTIVDGDVIAESNLNRQIVATVDNIGRSKVEAMKERLLSINPELNIDAQHKFYLPNTEIANSFDFKAFDFLVDAIDNVTAKIDIIRRCREADVPLISSMGTGNKLDNSQFRITDISKTKICPLAKVMRKELRDRGITNVPVLYSEEEPRKNKAGVPGSISFVPPTAGLTIACYVVNQLIKEFI